MMMMMMIMIQTCHSFLLLQPIHTIQQPQLYHHDTAIRAGCSSNCRNRFWGNEHVPVNTFVVFSSSSRSQQQQQRHCRNNNVARNRVVVYNNNNNNSPSILERPITTEERPTTTEERTTTTREERTSQKVRQYNDDETWEVRLYNDGLNTREHVSKSLVYVTGLSEYQAYSIMMQAHHTGMAIIGQYYYEIAEMFHDALKLEGIICDIVPVTNE
jgi:ATP-dependent Clp protease adaptor protein ClpS